MTSGRVAIASGAAAVAAAGLLLAGRVDASAITALALLLAARAACAAASPSGTSPRALGRQVASAPAWVAIVVVGALRAGSSSLQDLRGANAVAGLAIARGDVLLVAAAWLALVAGVLAIAGGAARGTTYRGLVATDPPLARLDLIAAGMQLVLLVTLFAGPQVTEAADVVPWAAAWLVGAAAVAGARRRVRWERADSVAVALGLVAAALALIGGPP